MEMTCYCPYCSSVNGVKKYGFARTRIQRYYCSICMKAFQKKYVYPGNDWVSHLAIKRLFIEGKSVVDIVTMLGIRREIVNQHIKLFTKNE